MPTKREREYYREGFADGMRYVEQSERIAGTQLAHAGEYTARKVVGRGTQQYIGSSIQVPKRKLSAWNKFVKANSKKSEFRYRDGKLNLKKMGVAFRRKKRR